jgi:hypothetical protein
LPLPRIASAVAVVVVVVVVGVVVGAVVGVVVVVVVNRHCCCGCCTLCPDIAAHQEQLTYLGFQGTGTAFHLFVLILACCAYIYGD